jgi:hypothetical protein
MIEHMFVSAVETSPNTLRGVAAGEVAGVTPAANEGRVRDALSECLLAQPKLGLACAYQEFWVPRSHERLDLAVVGARMHGFEIKTERDTLRRLPRQARAYGRVMDRCTVVLAEKHLEQARSLLPDWWGISTVACNGHIEFKTIRAPRKNPTVDAEILVRLLWRDEALAALRQLGDNPEPSTHRASLWRELLERCSLTQLRSAVRTALLGRYGSRASSSRAIGPPQVASAAAMRR